MEKQKMKEIPYSGIQMNGFVALMLLFLFIALTVLSFVTCANTSSDLIFGICLAGGIVLAIWSIVMLCGFFTLEPNEAVNIKVHSQSMVSFGLILLCRVKTLHYVRETSMQNLLR